MLRHRIFFIAFASLLLISWNLGQAQQWSQEFTVSPAGTLTPDFDIDPNNGHLHIVTMIEPAGVIYTEMDKNGIVIQQYPLEFAATDKASSGHAFGASISVDPQGRPHVCYRSAPQGDPPKYTTYYTYWNGSSWTSAIELSTRVTRGWMIRLDVDINGKAHIARGSMAGDPNDPEGNLLAGPVKYFRINNGTIESTLDDITRYCADRNLEIDTYQNQVHLILGTSDYPGWGGSVNYWRSFDGGNTWYNSDVHHLNTKLANSTPDIFVDASGIVHIIYGAMKDMDRNGKASVRYVRYKNSEPELNIPVTVEGDIFPREFASYGIASVAASGNGQIVIVAYSEDFGARLWVRESYNGGQSWSDPIKIADESCSAEGRNKHVIRAYSDKFYIVYPTPYGVKLRYKKFTDNQPPVAEAGGPYAGYEGSSVNFDASQSSDTDGNIISYEWDFQNDGAWDKTTTTPYTSFTYTDEFTGQIQVGVTDNKNEKSTDVANITIYNVPPTASAGGPYSGEIGQIIYFHGSATDPGNDMLTYKWDLNNDSIFETNGQNSQKSFSTGGVFIVSLQVTDGDGGSDVDTAYVSIQNEPPIIEGITDQVINEGENFDPIDLYAAVTDPDNPDNEISWTFLDNHFLSITKQYNMAYIAPVDSEWNGSETIQFIAKDPGQAADTAQVTFTVNPVNDPPVVKPITVPPINEGQTFDWIFLDNYVYDPDNKPEEIAWTTQGQTALTINIDQRVAIVTTPDQDWYGTENVTFVATDQHGTGFSGSRVVTFIVNPVNDAPEISSIPNQTVHHNQNFTQVFLDTCVTDIDNPVTTLQWSYSGNNQLVINIADRILTINKPQPDWIGTENITFTVSDGQLSDSYTTTFTAIYHNDPPVISNLQGAAINENGQFDPIYLDQKVSDPDDADNLLVWSCKGMSYLNVEGLAQRIIHITVPDSEWSGSETIRFIVTDPGTLKDSVDATFTVIPLNDPPKLKPMNDVAFNEDTTFIFTTGELQLLVFDPDNPFNELQFFIGNNIHTHSTTNPQTGDLIISADPNWNGVETVTFNVADKLYSIGSSPLKITVNPIPDSPMPFELLEPRYGTFYSVKPTSIRFVWEKAIDPDKNDIVTYTWNLSRSNNFEHIIDQYNSLADTVLLYQLPTSFQAGIYYWQVIAFDGSGNSIMCKNNGAFNIESEIGIESNENSNIPKEFALLQNNPNPFNPETQITYHLSGSCHVQLQIYNSIGQLIKTLVDQYQNAGIYSIYWNGKDSKGEPASSGIYIFKIDAGNNKMARKMLLLQ